MGKYTYYGDSGKLCPLTFPRLGFMPSFSTSFSEDQFGGVLVCEYIFANIHRTGKGVHCYYCKNCTSHVYHHQEVLGPDKIVLRTGLLDEGIKNFKPAAEIYGKAKLPWEKEVAQTFDTMPPS